MGRSVSYPRNAKVAFSTFEYDEQDFASDEFDFLLQGASESAASMWPSMSKCNKLVGREDHAIMENSHAFFGVSEYCGLVAYWLVAKDDLDHQPLADHWVESQELRLLGSFATLNSHGTMSNGEGVFSRIGA